VQYRRSARREMPTWVNRVKQSFFMFLAIARIGGEEPPAMGLELLLSSGQTVYLSVTQQEDLIGVVRVSDERIAGIRIVCRPENGRVDVLATALAASGGDLRRADYAMVRSWRGTPVGSFKGSRGDKFLLSLAKLNLPDIGIRIVAARPAPSSAPPDGFCSSDHASAFPKAGICMGVGEVGFCCRAGTSRNVVLVFPPNHAQ
jgi:hypothetical protein